MASTWIRRLVSVLPFRDGLTVREVQPTLRGYTPRFDRIEVRMRGVITARSTTVRYPVCELVVSDVRGRALD